MIANLWDAHDAWHKPQWYITFFIILKKIKDGRKFWSTPLGQVGGLQLKDAQPLEGKLKEFMDSATGDTTPLFDAVLKFSNTR